MNDISPYSCRWSWHGMIRASLERPVMFSAAITLIRLIVHPYLGIVHDAQLYAIQVQNRVTGFAYATDLYFAHGSQDQYSLFSWMVSPLASVIGVSAAFFVFYLVFSWLMVFATSRLISKLVPDVGAAFVAIVVLAVVDVHYGGWNIFQVHEPFLTPRLPACALILLALDALLVQQWLLSSFLVILALTLHPIMALGGAAVLVLASVWERWGGRTAGALAGAGIVAVCGAFTLGVLGWIPSMNGTWLETSRAISPQCFPSDWKVNDWVNILTAVTLVVWSHQSLSPRGRLFVLSSLIVGLGGLAVSCAAEFVPVATVVQAQTLRSLWILQYLAIPLAIQASFRLISVPGWASVIVSSALLCWGARAVSLEVVETPSFWVATIGCAGLGGVIGRSIRRASEGGIRVGIILGMWVGATLGNILVSISMLRFTSMLQSVSDPYTILVFVARSPGTALAVTLALGMSWALLFYHRQRIAWLAVVSLALVSLSARAWTAHSVDRDSIEFVRGELDAHRGDLPIVFWPTDVTHIWMGLPARSYCHFAQVQGAVFREELAKEARTRLEMTRNIEHRVLREKGVGAWMWERLGRVHGSFDRFEPVTSATVENILSPGGADIVVLPFPLPGREGSTNGHVWVYGKDDTGRGEHASLPFHHPGNLEEFECSVKD